MIKEEDYNINLMEPVLKGSEWKAYSLAKEVAWVAVDIAYCMRDINNWKELSVASIQPVNISMVSEDDSMHGLPGVSTPLPVSAVQDNTHRLMINHC